MSKALPLSQIGDHLGIKTKNDKILRGTSKRRRESVFLTVKYRRLHVGIMELESPFGAHHPSSTLIRTEPVTREARIPVVSVWEHCLTQPEGRRLVQQCPDDKTHPL